MFQKRFLPVTVLTGILAVVAVVGYFLPQNGQAVPARVALPNSGGPVVFEHARHESLGLECSACHHELAVGVKSGVTKCSVCHGAVSAPSFKEKHAQEFSKDKCVVCHHYESGTKDWGHKRHSAEFGIACTDCHHKDTSIEEKPGNCATCHEDKLAPTGRKAAAGEAPNFADAVHARCLSCHQKWFDQKARGCRHCHSDSSFEASGKEKRLHANVQVADCATCHKKPASKLIPDKMAAYHALCMGCHQKMGAGPAGKNDCGKCHIK